MSHNVKIIYWTFLLLLWLFQHHTFTFISNNFNGRAKVQVWNLYCCKWCRLNLSAIFQVFQKAIWILQDLKKGFWPSGELEWQTKFKCCYFSSMETPIMYACQISVFSFNGNMPINYISIKEKAMLYSIYYSFHQLSLLCSQGAEKNLNHWGAVSGLIYFLASWVF